MTDPFIHPYVPNTAPASRQAMLEAVGAESVDEFYADIPADLRLGRDLDLPEPLVAEQDLVRHVGGLLRRNRAVEPGRLFLGAGTYLHSVPAVVDEVERLNREWDGAGRVLVRPSGTEPLIRVLAEAENEAVAQEACASIAALVRRELG